MKPEAMVTEAASVFCSGVGIMGLVCKHVGKHVGSVLEIAE